MYNLLQLEVSFTVFPLIIKSADGLGMILYLWHVNPILVLRGYADAVSLDPDCITRILDICQDLKVWYCSSCIISFIGYYCMIVPRRLREEVSH